MFVPELVQVLLQRKKKAEHQQYMMDRPKRSSEAATMEPVTPGEVSRGKMSGF
jgi:hypothetical protein